MGKGNSKILIAIIVAVGIVAAMIYLRPKKRPTEDPGVAEEEVLDNSEEQEDRPLTTSTTGVSGATAAQPSTAVTQNAANKDFLATLGPDMGDCFNFQVSKIEPGTASGADLVRAMEDYFGGIRDQQEVWTDWKIQDSNGKVKEYRLENREMDDGVFVRSLYTLPTADSVDETPIFLDNPTDAQLDQYMKSGTVMSQEKLHYANFRNGERIEWREKDGKVMDFEVVREEKIFRCNSYEQRESCQCIK